MRHLYFLIPAVALAVIALSGCSAYTQQAGVTPAHDVRTDARACLLGSSSGLGFIAPVAGLAAAPMEGASMDQCMADRGWVRK